MPHHTRAPCPDVLVDPEVELPRQRHRGQGARGHRGMSKRQSQAEETTPPEECRRDMKRHSTQFQRGGGGEVYFWESRQTQHRRNTPPWRGTIPTPSAIPAPTPPVPDLSPSLHLPPGGSEDGSTLHPAAPDPHLPLPPQAIATQSPRPSGCCDPSPDTGGSSEVSVYRTVPEEQASRVSHPRVTIAVPIRPRVRGSTATSTGCEGDCLWWITHSITRRHRSCALCQDNHTH